MGSAADGEGRLPDFFLVGHPKSGTTALHAMLSQHPGVHLGQKEPNFFVPELRERPLPRPGGTPRTLSEYASWFAGARPDQLIGDVSPEYLWSRESARLIAEVRPDARVVAILREPAAFLTSLHRQRIRNYVEVETDLLRAMELEEARRAGRELPRDTYWPAALCYSEQARYVEQLRRYEQRFPHERMLVLIYDDYRSDGEATVRRLLRFLELDDDAPIRAREANPSVQVRSPRLHAAMRRLMVSDAGAVRAARRTVKAVTPAETRQRALRAVRTTFVFGEPAAAGQELTAELRRRLAPEVHALSEHLGRDLVSLWGYERLD